MKRLLSTRTIDKRIARGIPPHIAIDPNLPMRSRCGYCDNFGHNIRTCPDKASDDNAARSTQ